MRLRERLCSQPSAIDNPTSGTIRSSDPFRVFRMLVYRSEFDVPRSVPTHFWRGCVLVLSAGFGLLSALTPARAAGCHVTDVPVLHSRFSWERDQGLDRKSILIVLAPPILTHPPCQGESPDSPRLSRPSGQAVLLLCARSLQPGVAGRITVLPHHQHLQPLVFRVDRPPR
jgi:hypothetical protein